MSDWTDKKVPTEEEKKEKETKELENLKEALDKSSGLNRNLLLFFLTNMLYIFIVAASTTDRQLLDPNGTIKLPLLGVDIRLFAFYGAAPLLVLIFHHNILFNLLAHARKLHAWDEERKKIEGNTLTLYPFLYNHLVEFKVSVNAFLLKACIFLSYGLLPCTILYFIQWRFSAYHSLGMAIWHFIALVADGFLLLLFWPRVGEINKELLEEKYDYFLKLWKYIWNTDTVSPKKRILKYLYPPLIFFLITKNFFIIVLLFFNMIPQKPWFTVLSIKLVEQTLVTPPSDAILSAYITKGMDLEEAWLKHARGLDLRGRDLRFADFSKSDLRNADLRWADLRNANLSETKLQGARLEYAQLQSASLLRAQLQGAILSYAQLQGADLSEAQLQGTNLSGAEFEKMSFLSVYPAYFSKMNLGILLSLGGFDPLADLQGADLRGAKLHGADLSKTKLRGAIMEGAFLKGADFSEATLKGNYFENVDLEKEADWDVLIKDSETEISNEKQANLRKAFQERMKLARERKTSIEKSKLDNDYHKFLEIRKEMACKDLFVAEGILKQITWRVDDDAFKKIFNFHDKKRDNPFYEKLTQAQKETFLHIQAACPKILDQIKARGKVGLDIFKNKHGAASPKPKGKQNPK